jgi:hypothetical protein
MLQRGRPRLFFVLTLATVLALALSPPSGAAGWTVWRAEGPEAISGFFAHVLVRLGLAPPPRVVLKCGDQGSTIDPNGCPRAQADPETSQFPRPLRSARSREAN